MGVSLRLCDGYCALQDSRRQESSSRLCPRPRMLTQLFGCHRWALERARAARRDVGFICRVRVALAHLTHLQRLGIRYLLLMNHVMPDRVFD